MPCLNTAGPESADVRGNSKTEITKTIMRSLSWDHMFLFNLPGSLACLAASAGTGRWWLEKARHTKIVMFIRPHMFTSWTLRMKVTLQKLLVTPDFQSFFVLHPRLLVWFSYRGVRTKNNTSGAIFLSQFPCQVFSTCVVFFSVSETINNSYQIQEDLGLLKEFPDRAGFNLQQYAFTDMRMRISFSFSMRNRCRSKPGCSIMQTY